MTSVLYAVGPGSAVATDDAWLLVDAPPGAQVVRDLWDRLTAGPDREALLTALAGLSELPSFALVLAAAPGLVLVNGDARVVLEGAGGESTVESGGAAEWRQAALPPATTAVTLLRTGTDATAEVQVPALAGVFPTSALVVRWAPPAPPPPAAPPRPTTAPPVVPPAPNMPPPVAPPAPRTPPPVVPPAPVAPPPTSEAPEEPTEVLPSSGSPLDSFFDQESLPPLSDQPAAPPHPAGPPPSAPEPAGHGVLRISTGQQVVLDRGAVLGRSPEWHGPDQRHLVTVVGSFGDVSRSHVGVSLDGDGVHVVDLGSTNGTLVIQPDSPQHLLEVGVAEMLEPGAVVRLSRDVSFTYELDPR